MAKSEIIMPNGDKVTGDWATEETLSDILDVLEKAHGRKGKGGGEDDKARKEAAKEAKYTSKTFQGLSKRVDETKKSIRSQIKNQDELIKKSPKLAEAFAVTSDTAGIAGRHLKGLGSSTAEAVEELDKLDGSAKGASDALFKIVGGAGAIGTAFGIAAGVLDEFIEFQVGAVQRGFSFSGALVDTRTEVAQVGLRMRQLGDVIANNGEALRFLGDNGRNATKTFIGMIDGYKDSTRQFGYFGATTEEMSGQLIEQIDIMRKGGISRNIVEKEAVINMARLNEETYALARITGRERRDIMRNNLEMQEGNQLLLHNLGNLGPQAMRGYNSMMETLTGSFGADSPVIDLVNGMLETYFAGGQMKLSADELVMMDMIPGLRAAIEGMTGQFIDQAGNVNMRDMIGPAQALAEKLASQDDRIADKAELLGGEDGLGALMIGMLGSAQEAANILGKSQAELLAKMNEPMSEVEADMNMIRDRMAELQQQFMASLLNLFAPGDIANEETYKQMKAGIESFGAALGSIREGIIKLAEVFGDGDGTIADELMIGAAALFAANSVFTLAMVTGASAVWTAVSSALAGSATAASTTATGAGTAAAAGGGMKAMLKGGAKKIPYIGTLLGGLFGVHDEGYQDADFSWLDRFALGIGEGVADIGDLAVNVGSGAAWALGLKDTAGNNVDMSQSFKDWAIDNASTLAPYTSRTSNLDPEFQPGVSGSTEGYYVPETLSGITAGAQTEPGTGTIMPANIDPSVAWRFSDEQLARVAAATEENNRLMRKLTDAVENN